MSNLTESKLAALLKSSKAIMNKVEENSFSRGNIDPSRLVSESDGDDWVETPPTKQVSRPQPVSNNQSYKNINNSKMPKQIIEAMVNNRIDIPESPFHTFEVSDSLVREVNSIDENYDYEEKPIPNRLSQPPKRVENKRQVINESSSDIREMIKEELSNILPKVIAEYFDKRVISEQIQVKVGNTLFSGNLKPLPSKLNKK